MAIVPTQSEVHTPFQLSYSGGVYRSLAEDTYTIGNAGVDATYFTGPHLFGGRLSYTNAFSKYEDPNVRGLSDLQLYVQHNDLYFHPTLKFSTFGLLDLILPLSKTSQRAGLYSALGVGFGFLLPRKKYSMRQTNEILFFFHEFDTVDLAGQEPNAEYALKNNLSISLKINKRISWSNSGQIFTYWTYSGKQHVVQQFTSNASYRLSKKLNLFSEFSVKDKIVSNNSLFDDENTTIMIGVHYVN